jgi:hypothetical protein
MYQYNDRLKQLFTKYKYMWLWLQCFDHYLGHRQVYIMNLESVLEILGTSRCVDFLSSLYRPDDDPDKGRNILAEAKYIYTW